MLLNALYLTFVSAFIVVVVIGHVLLAAAIWPRATAAIRSGFARKRAARTVSANATPEPSVSKPVMSSEQAAA